MAVLEKGGESPARKSRFSAQADKIGNDAVIHCSGRLCFEGEARLLAETAQPFLNMGSNLVLDFANLDLLDSAGIGELVLISMHARAIDREVLIVSAPERICSLLRLTNVASLFKFFDSIEAALSQCSSNAA